MASATTVPASEVDRGVDEPANAGLSWTPNDLPQPDEPVQHDVVIFDGRCKLCRREIRRLQRFDRGGRLRYLALQDSRVATLLPDKTEDQLMSQIWVATTDGHSFGGIDAGRYLSRTIPRLWWLAPMLHFPGLTPLWWALYRLIARNRYRWFGRLDDHEADDGACTDDACAVHF